MPYRRYQEQTLSDAAVAAGSAFGMQGEESEAPARARGMDVRAIAAVALGLCILVTMAVFMLR